METYKENLGYWKCTCRAHALRDKRTLVRTIWAWSASLICTPFSPWFISALNLRDMWTNTLMYRAVHERLVLMSCFIMFILLFCYSCKLCFAIGNWQPNQQLAFETASCSGNCMFRTRSWIGNWQQNWQLAYDTATDHRGLFANYV